MKRFNLILFIIPYLILVNCKNEKVTAHLTFHETESITCTDDACRGTYQGEEFINGDDIAHQFSNSMSAKVGDQLKKLYQEGKYVMVDFDKIIMTTDGMGSGIVTYYLEIPFKRVEEKCKAYTSFDHVGGWDHAPALSQRKEQLKSALMEGHELFISDLKTTKEGLEEYWIQWKNKVTQAGCR